MNEEKQKLPHVEKTKMCPEETADITSNSIFFANTKLPHYEH
jgi:hypothetical protein